MGRRIPHQFKSSIPMLTSIATGDVKVCVVCFGLGMSFNDASKRVANLTAYKGIEAYSWECEGGLWHVSDEASCKTKKPYHLRSEAGIAYPCHCGYWHSTSQAEAR